jgi:hypothetical protein
MPLSRNNHKEEEKKKTEGVGGKKDLRIFF